MSQKINATDVTEEEALNAVFFERADEFIKQANEFCRPPKGQKTDPAEQFDNYLRFRKNEDFHTHKHDHDH